MKNLFTTLLIFLALSLSLSAQHAVRDQQIIRCATMEADAELRARFPNIGTLDDFERWLAPRVKAYKSQDPSRMAVVTLPIIFHVIHNGEEVGVGSNIAANLIAAQIEQLNNDFRKITGTSGDNSNPVGADSEIEFCPALINPGGMALPEPGINRINRNDQGWSAAPYSRAYVQGTIKPASQWDPNRYINIWVLNLGSSLLGYAQFPSQSGLPGLDDDEGAANTDGVVIRTSSIGSTATPNPGGGAYAAGRTLTHELGHFFGLRHIWGDGTGCAASGAALDCACSLDDFCDDTPNAGRANYGCPDAETCGSVDMKENYMDYTDDTCMNIFTFDQKARMQAVMINSPRRVQLLTSDACEGCTTPPVAVCQNATIALDAAGMATLSPNLVDGGSTAVCGLQGLSVSPSAFDCTNLGSNTVTLTVTDMFGNSSTCTANVSVIKSFALPAPWSGQNIGSPGAGNSYQYDPCLPTPEYTISAGSANNSIPSDNLAFIQQSICGDFNITVKVESVSANSWAGLHARESSTAGSRMLGMYSNLGSIVRWESRAVTNGNKAINLFSRPFPYWLRLVRQGNMFIGYYSLNGTSYSIVNIQMLPLNACLNIGISAFSSIPGQTATAVFSNLSAGSGVMPLAVMPGNTVEPAGLDRQQAGIRLFPNPARDLVTLEFPSQTWMPGDEAFRSGAATLRLRNELGQLIEERRLDELPERMDWNVNSLNPGMYFIEVHAEGQMPQMLRWVKAQ
jgi:hypothetical protein